VQCSGCDIYHNQCGAKQLCTLFTCTTLSPHSALIARKATSSIPHKLYVQDSDERMVRLHLQFVPFGICCSVVQTGHKPQQVKMLDPRSVPGIIVGYTHDYPRTEHETILSAGSTYAILSLALQLLDLAPRRRRYWYTKNPP
jgi:hypothetical protein